MINNKTNQTTKTIKDFFHELPKVEFTLEEWVQFVETHPHYLTINEPEIKAITLAISKGLDNLNKQISP